MAASSPGTTGEDLAEDGNPVEMVEAGRPAATSIRRISGVEGGAGVPGGPGSDAAAGFDLSGSASHLAARGTVEGTVGVPQASTGCKGGAVGEEDLDASPPTAASFEQELGRALAGGTLA